MCYRVTCEGPSSIATIVEEQHALQYRARSKKSVSDALRFAMLAWDVGKKSIGT